MMRSALVAFALSALATAACAEEPVYEVGQVWEYETSSLDEGSLVKIQEIETIGPEDEPLQVFHISMIGVNYAPSEGFSEIMHLPVSRETLDQSVTRQSDSTAIFPDHREGLEVWRENNGGVFTLSLVEIADIIREQYTQPENPAAHKQLKK